jgi:hypothetical protein
MTFFYVGLAPAFILFMLVSYKKLRNGHRLKILSVFSFILAILGLVIKTPEAASFSISFFYIISYAFLRYLYLRKYGLEPTYYNYSWYDAEEGRRQNWLDVIVYVVPIFFSFIASLALLIAKAKGYLII